MSEITSQERRARQTDLLARLTAAMAITREAGQLARRHFLGRAALTVEYKGMQDVVSIADREVEALIVQRLTALFPEDGMLGEEGAGRAGGERLWIIDAIDGTANFLRGIPLWCVSVGMIDKAGPAIGVIYDPMAGELFAAARGLGATRNGTPIRVSGETDPRRATIGTGFSYRRPVPPYADMVRHLLEAGCEYRRYGSGALMMAHTADGRVDGYAERHINAWDVAAGLVLVAEAGGWTSDFFAGDGLKSGNPILACTPGLTDFLRGKTGLG